MSYRPLLLLVSVPVALVLTACGGSSSSSTSPSSAAAGSSSAGESGGSSPASASSVAPASSGGATFSGDFSGTIAANLCTGSIMSITVKVAGDSTTYLGSISATSAGFVGPEAADYTVPEGGSTPTVTGTTFDVEGVVVEDVVVSHKKVTLHGSLTCR